MLAFQCFMFYQLLWYTVIHVFIRFCFIIKQQPNYPFHYLHKYKYDALFHYFYNFVHIALYHFHFTFSIVKI